MIYDNLIDKTMNKIINNNECAMLIRIRRFDVLQIFKFFALQKQRVRKEKQYGKNGERIFALLNTKITKCLLDRATLAVICKAQK